MRRRLLLSAACAALALPLAAAPADAARMPPKRVGKTVTLQKGIGALKTGVSERTARRLLGKPNKATRLPAPDGRLVAFQLDYRRKYGLVLFFDLVGDRNVVSAIIVKHRQFRTREGLRVGGTFAQFQAKHPQMPCGRRASSPDDRLCYLREETAAGVTRESQFVFDGDRIIEISVAVDHD